MRRPDHSQAPPPPPYGPPYATPVTTLHWSGRSAEQWALRRCRSQLRLGCTAKHGSAERAGQAQDTVRYDYGPKNSSVEITIVANPEVLFFSGQSLKLTLIFVVRLGNIEVTV